MLSIDWCKWISWVVPRVWLTPSLVPCWSHPCLQLTILCRHCLTLCSGAVQACNVSSRPIRGNTIDPPAPACHSLSTRPEPASQAPSHCLYNHPLATNQSQCQMACFSIDLLTWLLENVLLTIWLYNFVWKKKNLMVNWIWLKMYTQLEK